MTAEGWDSLARRLTAALHLNVQPIAIGFSTEPHSDLAPFAKPMASAAGDGRTGRVAAGCVFWMKATESSFHTLPQDHGNCSVGSLTHGLVSLEEVSDNEDVAALLSSGWVTPEMVPGIPFVSRRPAAINYGPLQEAAFEPDVILLRVNGRQLMVLSDAEPSMEIQGKPQCHIVAIAKEQQRMAASVGCALSRARTGMQPTEMTCAIPASKLEDLVSKIEVAAAIDSDVAKYAANDSRRFATQSG